MWGHSSYYGPKYNSYSRSQGRSYIIPYGGPSLNYMPPESLHEYRMRLIGQCSVSTSHNYRMQYIKELFSTTQNEERVTLN